MTDHERSTPLANAFFKMVIFGGVAGAATSLALTIFGSFTSEFPHLLTVITQAGVAFVAGIPVSAAAAAPAIGLHTLAAARAPRFRIPAAALGAVLGPLAVAGMFAGGSPLNVPVPGIAWVLFLPAAALAAVHFTRPLRPTGTGGNQGDGVFAHPSSAK